MMKVVLGYEVWVEYLTKDIVNWGDGLCASYDYGSTEEENTHLGFCNDLRTILLKPGDEVWVTDSWYDTEFFSNSSILHSGIDLCWWCQGVMSGLEMLLIPYTLSCIK